MSDDAPLDPVAEARFARVAGAEQSLATVPPSLRRAIGEATQFVQLREGDLVFRPEQGCTGYPILLAGRVRVSRPLESGREFMLYDVERGESCVMSTGCLLGNLSYGAQGMCLEDTEIALLPRALFERLIAEHAPFRRTVFSLFAERLARLMELVEEVGFQRLDQRLAGALLGKGQRIDSSHEQLARSLGVSRESVSRQLKQFEDRGWVKLGRGVIDVLDPRALRDAAVRGMGAAASERADAS